MTKDQIIEFYRSALEKILDNDFSGPEHTSYCECLEFTEKVLKEGAELEKQLVTE